MIAVVITAFMKKAARMAVWQDYLQHKQEHTVAGHLRQLSGVYSPQLDNTRDIFVYLPPSYHHNAQRRYPVIYMHDGQNLFDQTVSFGDEWQVDETLQGLANEGLEAIVVGIANTESRLNEYSPFVDEQNGGGQGNAYLDFVIHTVKPIIDNDFRTLTDAACTGIMGSSMGGLISLYGFFHRPHVFGFAGVMSPALWFANYAIFDDLRQCAVSPGGLLYLDVGTNELGENNPKSQRYVETVRGLRNLLAEKGYHEQQNLIYIEAENATHSEYHWAQRMPDSLRFLLSRCQP
jgi:predicted alpha/beta superfamily hydrolase